jgi:hypothetical protein
VACVVSSPPTIEAAAVFFNPAVGALGIQVAGQDADHDVVSVQVRLLNEAGADVLSPGQPATLLLDDLVQAAGRYQGRFSGLLPEGLPPFVTAELVVIDRQDLTSDAVEVELSAPALGVAGAPCDANFAFDLCPEGTACTPNEAQIDTCSAADAPVLVEANVYFNPATASVGVRLRGTDANTNVAGFAIELLDPMGQAIDLFGEFPFDALEQADGGFLGTTTLGLPEDTLVGQARVQAIDATGLYSEAVLVNVAPPPEVALGRPCDIFGGLDVCAPGSACADPDGRGAPECVVARAPVIATATLTFNPAAGAVGLRVTGTDLDADASGFYFDLLDGGGMSLQITAEGPFPDIAHVETAFTGSTSFDGYPGDAPNPQRARVQVVDLTGLFSEPLEVVVAAPPVVPQDGACDALAGLDVCAQGTFCVDGRCTRPAAECAPGVQTGLLNDHPVANGFRVNSDSTGNFGVDRGSCGGGAGADVWAFTAPAAGTWRFETTVSMAHDDTVLFARSLCGVPAAELACNDDAPGQGNRFSRVDLALQAGETIYLFVDGFSGSEGPYSLSATRRAP